jgi:phage tail sheath protein FI
LIAGLARLSPISDLDLIAIPDSACLTDAAARRRVQAQALRHCREHGDRFAILDAPQGIDPLNSDIGAAFAAWRKELAAEALENGACYYPWIKVLADDGAVREVPPCGHIAGVYARTDTATGVFKAPANETLNAVLDLTYPIDAEIQGKLNPIGVNCIRALPGRGLRVYGARTLSLALNWRYVNVRRLVLTLGRWIERNMAWSAFEPSTPRLWSRIARELGGYLDGLWLSGALRGGSPTDAYTVKCDAETNPPAVRDRGEVVVEVALAPALPAERLVLRITQSASGVRLE